MNTKIISSALLVTVALASCKKQVPIACIAGSASGNGREVLVNEDFNLTSCATDAATIAWNFGDATTAEGESVTHKYSKAGTYAVNQRVSSKKNKAADNTVVIITVKDAPVIVAPIAKSRYLTKIVLRAFPQDNGGAKWDPGTFSVGVSDADLFINFGADSTILFHSDFVVNASQAILPKTYSLNAFNFKLENKNYFIDLGDDDGSNLSNLTWTKMRTLTANLSTAAATNGKITLTDTDCIIDIYFEER